MSKRDSNLVRLAGEHVFQLFRGAKPEAPLVYHGFQRARELVSACRDVARGCKLDERDSEIVLLAAWFHDACYATAVKNGLAASLDVCREFLVHHQVPQEVRERVIACLMGVDGSDHGAEDARNNLHHEHHLVDDVLHDGLLASLSSKSFVEDAELLRLELERAAGKLFSDVEWTERCIAMLEGNSYRTRYAQLEYNAGRAANVVRLHKILRRQVEDAANERAEQAKVSKGIGKTVESVFYYLTRFQVALMGLADKRTSTMIHVNAIMISIVVALLVRKLDTHRNLMFPTLVLLTVNLTVIVMAIYSMRSARAAVPKAENQIHDANLLLFTNGTPVTLPEYSDRMTRLALDVPEMQRAMIEHMYFARKMLVDRQRALRITYDVFIYGLAGSLLAFGFALIGR